MNLSKFVELPIATQNRSMVPFLQPFSWYELTAALFPPRLFLVASGQRLKLVSLLHSFLATGHNVWIKRLLLRYDVERQRPRSKPCHSTSVDLQSAPPPSQTVDLSLGSQLSSRRYSRKDRRTFARHGWHHRTTCRRAPITVQYLICVMTHHTAFLEASHPILLVISTSPPPPSLLRPHRR